LNKVYTFSSELLNTKKILFVCLFAALLFGTSAEATYFNVEPIPSDPTSKKSYFDVLTPGVISGKQAFNGGYDPSIITGTAATGSLTTPAVYYQWQSSTNGINWVNIAGATGLNYDPTNITVTTHYQRKVGNIASNGFEGVSNIISKVVTDYVISTPGSINAGSTINLTTTATNPANPGSFPNLLENKGPNSNFTAGATGFTTQVTTVYSQNTGQYGVASNPTTVFPNNTTVFTDISGDGKMMLVRIPRVNAQKIWSVTIPVINGNRYSFQAMIRTFYNTNTPTIGFFVGNTQVGPAITASSNFTNIINSHLATASGNLEFSIRTISDISSSQYIALDDIYIFESTPPTYSWTGPNGFTSTLLYPTIPFAGLANSGLYTLTITKNGVSTSVSKNITVSSGAPVCLPLSVSPTLTSGVNLTCFNGTNGQINVGGQDGSGGSGSISYKRWNGITGSTIASLTSNINFINNTGSNNNLLDKTQVPINDFADDYGTQIVGYLVPRLSGPYTFWASGDDVVQVFLSTTSLAANKVSIIQTSTWTLPLEWNKAGANQKSVTINLVAGQRYYFEILHKEGAGGDNLAVGWTKPGDPVNANAPFEIIPASAIRPFTPAALALPIYSYSINNGVSFQTSNNFTGLVAGTYQVRVQDTYGCISPAYTVTLTQPADFVTGASSNSPVCESTTLNLSGVDIPNATYVWSHPNGFNSNIRTPQITNTLLSDGGTYTLITTTINGCVRTNSTNVVITPKPQAIYNVINPGCGFNNGSFVFTFPDNPDQTNIQFSINNGVSYSSPVNDNTGTFAVNGLATGTYLLRARWWNGSAGCEFNMGSVTLTSTTNLLGFTLTPTQTTCVGTSISLTGFSNAGVAPYSYSWTTPPLAGAGTNTATYAPTGTTDYTLKITDNAGCFAEGTTRVNVVNKIQAQVISDKYFICLSGNVSATMKAVLNNVSAGTVVTYRWQSSFLGSPYADFSLAQTADSLKRSYTALGDYSYRVIIGGSGACQGDTTSPIVIKVLSLPTPTISYKTNDTTCIGTPIVLKALMYTGTGATVTYKWQSSPPPDPLYNWSNISNTDSLIVNRNNSGPYYYRFEGDSNVGGCSNAVSSLAYPVYFVKPADLTLTPNISSICLNGSQLITATLANQASGTIAYQWQTSDNGTLWTNIVGATGPIYNALAAPFVDTKYYRPVLNTSYCGLYYPTKDTLNTVLPHTVDISIDKPIICRNTLNPPLSTITGVVTGGSGVLTYQWQVKNGAGTFVNVTNGTGGNTLVYRPATAIADTLIYRLNVTSSASGCGTVSSSEVTLQINPPISVTLGTVPSLICRNSIDTLFTKTEFGVKPISYRWQVLDNGTYIDVLPLQTDSILIIPTSVAGTKTYRIIAQAPAGLGCAPFITPAGKEKAITVLELPNIFATNSSNIPTIPAGLGNTASQCIGTIVSLYSTTNTIGVNVPAVLPNSYIWSSNSGFSAFGTTNASALLLTGASGGNYTVTVQGVNGCFNSDTTLVRLNPVCTGCTDYINVRPFEPTTCGAADGSIEVFGASANYEHSIDATNWFSGNRFYTGLAVGTYLMYFRNTTTNVICRTQFVNVLKQTGTLAGKIALVTPAASCFDTGGSIRFTGVAATDQVSIKADLNRTFVQFSTLTNNTVTGLRPGLYLVKIAQGNSFCIIEDTIRVPNLGVSCTQPITCVVPISTSPVNLFPNGSFGSGVPVNGLPLPFTETAYGYVPMNCNSPNDGTYSIVNTTNCNGTGGRVFGAWDVFNQDNTGNPGGYFMLVNAAYTKDVAIQRVIPNLCPNSQYNFQAYVRNVIPDNSPGYSAGNQPIPTNLSFLVDGVIQYTTGVIRTGGWRRVGFAFKTGENVTSATFAIRNNFQGGNGNDWALDDIVVNKCPLQIDLDGKSEICIGGTTQKLTATIIDPLREHNSYLWQESTDGGSNWTTLTTVAEGVFVNDSLKVSVNLTRPTTAPITKIIRIRVATTNGSINDPVCSVTDTLTQIIVPPIKVVVSLPTTICSGAPTTLTATASGGSTPYTYIWTNTASTGSPITVSPTNTTTANINVKYVVTARDKDNCPAKDSVIITVRPTINITNPGPQTICSNGTFSRAPISNLTPTTFRWTAAITTAPTGGTITGFSNNATASLAPISQTLVNAGTTNGVVTYTVTPVANGCDGTPFTFAITVQPTININTITIPAICSGGNPAAVTPTVTNTVALSTNLFSWSLQGALPVGVTFGTALPTVATADVDLPVINNTTNAPVTLTFNISGTNSTNNCPISARTFTVVVNPTPTITGTLTLCSNGSTQLTGTGTAATTTPWSSSTPSVATVSSTGLVTGLLAGNTTIRYTNSNGCFVEVTVVVTAPQTVVAGGPNTICQNGIHISRSECGWWSQFRSLEHSIRRRNTKQYSSNRCTCIINLYASSKLYRPSSITFDYRRYDFMSSSKCRQNNNH
jgi:large repetitive protein